MKNKYFKYKVFIILIGTIVSQLSYAQEKGKILSKYYSTKDYKAGTQNWCIAQDIRGVMYFGNNNGVLEYDGYNWRNIEIPNSSSVRSLAFDKNNVLFVGAYGEIGFLSPSNTGELIYKSLNYLVDSSHKDFGEIWDIYCFSDTVFFLSDLYLIRFHNNKFDYWESKGERFYLSHKLDHNFFVQDMGKGLFKFENDSLKLIEKGDFFKELRIHNILHFEDKLLICTRTKGFYIYDKSGDQVKITSFSNLSEKTKELDEYFIENSLYHAIELSDSTYALSTVTGTILIVDKNWDILDVINNESIGIKSSIHYLYFQKNHSLWLALGNGISQVEISSPYRFWGDNQGVNGTFTDVAKLGDNLYFTTLTGVYYTNTKNQSKFELSSFLPVKGNFEQSWGFLYFQPPHATFKENPFKDSTYFNLIRTDKSLLLVSTSLGLFQIIDDKSYLISDYKAIFKSYQYKKDPSILFLGLNNGIAMLSYKNKTWKDHGLVFDIHDIIRDIIEDTLGNLWLSASYKGVYKIENPAELNSSNQTIEFFDSSSNLPSVTGVQIVKFQDTLFFYSDTNIYVYNPNIKDFDIYHIPKESSQDTTASEEIRDSLSIYRIYEDRLTDEYIIDYDDPFFWYGTNKGTCRYSFNPNINLLDVHPALIRTVLANDSVIYHGTNYISVKDEENSSLSPNILNPSSIVDIGTILEFKNNSLTFFFSSPFFDDETKNKFQFYLDGFDNKWSEWTTENKKEYTNLREGDYIFKVKSINIYNIETPLAEFKFTILPPWYRNFSAYIGYMIIGILIIILIVKLYTKRLIKEKDKLEKIVIERTQEILMQKEEILVQAEHLKDANEWISAKNTELEQQKWEITNQAIKLRKANIELLKLSKVASETDNAIAIFDKKGNIEWVNDGFTRLYGYTLDQFKKEKNTNIIDGSYNPNIREAILSCINDKKSVVYEFKTTTREGKEIWAQTTLTHVVDKDGETLNLVAIDSNITEIKLAEKKLAEQRDKLAISNATKNKFFRIIAHDLRNPISTLAGSTNLIFNDFDEYDKEQTKLFIGELNKLSQTTFNLLENLLDWSSTQMGDISFNPKSINLQFITDENIELIKRKIDQKHIHLSINIPENSIAFADENMVKTVVRNLLSNAVKFTPEKGKIEILAETKNNFIHYKIVDSGVGIQKENLSKLFKIDQHYTTLGLDEEKGSGLGLILCKEFVEKNGGEINIDSSPNNGTTIEFTLKKNVV